MMRSFVFFLLFLVTASVGLAQIPRTIVYQGVVIVNSATGETAANGSHTARFAFYDSPIDGNFKWQVVNTVTTYRGLFKTIINVPENASWHEPLFVRLTVDGVEQGNRIPVTTVPFAFTTPSADIALSMNASGLTGAVAYERLSAHLQDLFDGELSGSKVETGIKASNVTDGTSGMIPNDVLDSDLLELGNTGALPGFKAATGIAAAYVSDASKGFLPNSVLDDDLQDLAVDGSLAPTRLESGIDASKIGTGTLSNNVLDEDLQDLASDGVLSASRLEDLDASKVSTGVLEADQVPNFDASKIFQGQFGSERMPELSATKISSGQLALARIPDLDASKITEGQFPLANLPNLDAAKVNTGEFTESFIPNLPAAQVTTEQFAVERIPALGASKVTGMLPAERIPNLDAAIITSDEFNADQIPSLDASKITAGALSSTVLPNVVTGTGSPISKLPYWTAANQIGATAMHWDAANERLGLGTATPTAPLTIQHAPGMATATAFSITNRYTTTKAGLNVEANGNNSAAETQGIDIFIESSGTGEKIGVNANVTSTPASVSLATGFEIEVTGSGNGKHIGGYGRAAGIGGNQIGVRGEAEGTGVGYQCGIEGSVNLATNATLTGVKGEATGGGTGSHYGVHGTASGDAANARGVYGDGASAEFGVYSDGNLYVDGNITADGTIKDILMVSDRRLKKGILEMPSTLGKLLQLNPSTYHFRRDEFRRLNLDDGLRYGLIAQEVEKIFPELVTKRTMSAHRDESGRVVERKLSFKALDYTSLIPVLVKGMQEHQAAILSQQTLLEAQKSIADREQQSIDELIAELKEFTADKNATGKSAPSRKE
jgi:hypothetical protein